MDHKDVPSAFRPGVRIELDLGPPPMCLPPDLCWKEFYEPPASEVANGYCYNVERAIYGWNGPEHLVGDWSPYESGPWPVLMPRYAEYFCVYYYKDKAL
jgi:hypothetical protein